MMFKEKGVAVFREKVFWFLGESYGTLVFFFGEYRGNVLVLCGKMMLRFGEVGL